ncbi:glutathione peroxidase [Paenibacillus baekrokdamisoli]|uniref:Glutathione peroxidase n=1 Tax=Paenibacillus baekrokdamisoli TaxID=1712516 RepID=A0A3G9IXX2_9BACL|nr:glutathione peroxidase [Paenibacillus baekrokdamisoli]MBB3068924.1 glutathione peroxidase [Paenibacillus baekrokdamisoli]BBH23747.1 glutathione peroxidase [Paenibacillus baekrokdamisoli]
MTTIYDFQAETNNGAAKALSDYKGKVLLVTNTASKCGFTYQYEGLQKVYEEYKDKGLEVLGFPSNQFGGQEPGSDEEVAEFCQINYGVSFPLFAKTDVREETAHPVFQYLTEAAPFVGFDSSEGGQKMDGYLRSKMPERMEDNSIKWNFTKFLINREGQVVKRYESSVNPLDIKADIEALL